MIALNKAQVKYVLVGGYSAIFHEYNRITGDLDLYLEPSTENYNRLMIACVDFGLPGGLIDKNQFINPFENDVFTFGRPPVAIDLMVKLANFSFEEVHNQSTIESIDGINMKVIHLNHLKIAKKIAGRYKDLDDLEHL